MVYRFGSAGIEKPGSPHGSSTSHFNSSFELFRLLHLSLYEVQALRSSLLMTENTSTHPKNMTSLNKVDSCGEDVVVKGQCFRKDAQTWAFRELRS